MNMNKLIVVKLADSKCPADGGIVCAVVDSLEQAFAARLVPACGIGKPVLDSQRVIWKGFAGVKVGDRVRLCSA